jgi:hypothetical protein
MPTAEAGMCLSQLLHVRQSVSENASHSLESRRETKLRRRQGHLLVEVGRRSSGHENRSSSGRENKLEWNWKPFDEFRSAHQRLGRCGYWTWVGQTWYYDSNLSVLVRGRDGHHLTSS